MERVKSRVKGFKYLDMFFAFVCTVLVTFKFYFPGYLMTLDAVVGPLGYLPELESNYFSNSAWQFVNYFLGIIFGTMLLQKMFLFFLFFCLFYFPLKYFPFEDTPTTPNPSSGRRAIVPRYLGAIFFAINPFVLERFLAGQWGVVAGYAFLYPYIYYLINFIKEQNIKKLQRVLLTIFAIGFFSFHIFVMAVLIFVFSFVFLEKKFILENIKNIFVNFLMFLVLNTYWLYPYLSTKKTILDTFNQIHVQAFTTNILNLGLFSPISIFTLYGFWGERELWASQFGIQAYSNLIFFLPIFILCMFGVWILFKLEKKVAVFFTSVFVLSGIFSLGISETVFLPLNQFLFDHVFFWTGFRDSQKWSAILALISSISLVLGLTKFSNGSHNKKTYLLQVAVFLCVLLYSLQMLVSFWFVLKPVDYPKGWYQVNVILKVDKNCKAIFLPWHMYYYFSVNNNLLTGNPASKFFNCKVYTSLDPEFYAIGEVYNKDEKKNIVDKIMGSEKSTDEKLNSLVEQGIGYVIITKDSFGDQFSKEIAVYPQVIPILEESDIVLYKIVAKLE
jgi:hypothetical protein